MWVLYFSLLSQVMWFRYPAGSVHLNFPQSCCQDFKSDDILLTLSREHRSVISNCPTSCSDHMMVRGNPVHGWAVGCPLLVNCHVADTPAFSDQSPSERYHSSWFLLSEFFHVNLIKSCQARDFLRW
jgi:hypothetical protein